MSTISTVGVVGAGQMGSGIAQVAAQAGLSVIVTDINQQALDKGKKAVADSLARLVKKEALTQAAADAAQAKITWGLHLAAHAKAQFVVEAASENEALKKKIFTELDGICPPETLLASNTSSSPRSTSAPRSPSRMRSARATASIVARPKS